MFNGVGLFYIIFIVVMKGAFRILGGLGGIEWIVVVNPSTCAN